MALEELLSQSAITPSLHARCKREALSAFASKAAELIDVDGPAVEQALMEREALGSTGVGHGVAIPHGKVAGLERIVALFGKLDSPLDFDAVDGEPVDLVFVLLAPEEAAAGHLKALAKVSRLLRDEKVREALRGAETAEALYAVMTESERSHAA